ncbi:MAG: hypothetical protein ACOZBZ_00240 [Patescibacteria group bacterium]
MKLKKENSFLILLAAAILLIGMVGIYLSKKPPARVKDTQTQKLQIQQKSDETSSIEQDLKATDFSGLDKELEDIEAELSGI